MRTSPFLCILLVPTLFAADDGGQEAEPDGPWSHGVKLSLFADSVTSKRAARSNDPVISGSGEDQYGYRLMANGTLDYVEGQHSWAQRLDMSFGRRREGDGAWTDSIDEIIYDGQYDYNFRHPHSAYVATGMETVFSGPEPDADFIDPILLRASAGYAQRYENLLPEEDKLNWRVGVRVQKRWGDSLDERAREAEFGWEGRIRYERKQTASITYFGQYDIFGEFDDAGHVSHTFQAGVDILLASYVTLKVGFRAYYESEPDDAEEGDTGYDELSWRQESLIGLTYSF